jgi:hypothetical protein
VIDEFDDPVLQLRERQHVLARETIGERARRSLGAVDPMDVQVLRSRIH